MQYRIQYAIYSRQYSFDCLRFRVYSVQFFQHTVSRQYSIQYTTDQIVQNKVCNIQQIVFPLLPALQCTAYSFSAHSIQIVQHIVYNSPYSSTCSTQFLAQKIHYILYGTKKIEHRAYSTEYVVYSIEYLVQSRQYIVDRIQFTVCIFQNLQYIVSSTQYSTQYIEYILYQTQFKQHMVSSTKCMEYSMQYLAYRMQHIEYSILHIVF